MGLKYRDIQRKVDKKMLPRFLRNWETVIGALERHDPNEYEEDYLPLKEIGLDGNLEEASTISIICQYLEINTDEIKEKEDSTTYYNLERIIEHPNYDAFVSGLEDNK